MVAEPLMEGGQGQRHILISAEAPVIQFGPCPYIVVNRMLLLRRRNVVLAGTVMARSCDVDSPDDREKKPLQHHLQPRVLEAVAW